MSINIENMSDSNIKVETLGLITACAEWLETEHGATHWIDYYVKYWDRLYQTQISQEQIFGYRDEEGILVGLCACSNKPPTYYRKRGLVSQFNRNSQNPLYISTLAVHPSKMQKGIGRILLSNTEEVATSLGHTSLRLDTRDDIVPISSWYQRYGFTQIPNSGYDDANGNHFSLYEMMLVEK